MGINTAPPWAMPGCECCGPNGKRETVTHTTPLPPEARHAFLLAASRISPHRLPRDVLQRIFALAVVEERRVVTRHIEPAVQPRRDHRLRSTEPDPFAFGMLCLDASDDIP